MNSFQYTLDSTRPNRLFTCPNCKHKEFKRYVDTESGQYLPAQVGRCNRENSCGYHLTPRQHFSEAGRLPTRRRKPLIQRTTKHRKASRPTPSILPFELFKESLENSQTLRSNNLARYLFGCFHTTITNELIRRYFIGSTKHRTGATVFWQIDIEGRIRAGKVMQYDPITGQRSKEQKPTWIHTLERLPNYQLQQCFFGEHLLSSESKDKPVAVVESEKTAIIASIYLPKYVWLASGGKQNLTVERCKVLAGRDVIFFPDLGCYEDWKSTATAIRADVGCRVAISNLLEEKATEHDRKNGFDIADYLICTCPNFGWALTEQGYPMFWDEV